MNLNEIDQNKKMMAYKLCVQGNLEKCVGYAPFMVGSNKGE
jgi:hypothetical protein